MNSEIIMYQADAGSTKIETILIHRHLGDDNLATMKTSKHELEKAKLIKNIKEFYESELKINSAVVNFATTVTDDN